MVRKKYFDIKLQKSQFFDPSYGPMQTRHILQKRQLFGSSYGPTQTRHVLRSTYVGQQQFGEY